MNSIPEAQFVFYDLTNHLAVGINHAWCYGQSFCKS
jgi:hypothetical protein